jgi:hypothetical protein
VSPGRIPHQGPTSPAEAAWFEFRRVLSGPLGCLVALLCLPFALIALVVMFGVALWKGRKLRQAIQGQMAAERTTGDGLPVAHYVRMFAADPSFSRDEATQAAVPASAGKTAQELLDEAMRRGWIEVTGDRLVVTDRGREQAETLLRARGE